MYHALTNDPGPPLNPVHISIELFRQEMEWLAKNGYHTIHISELVEAIPPGIDKKLCAITFDDGYHSLFEEAIPVLKKYGFTATLYLTTGIVGKENFSSLQNVDLHSIPPSDRPLTWEEVREMKTKGWSIQSHSISHADHCSLTDQQLFAEIVESKKKIEQELNVNVSHYAFPFGKYNNRSLDMLKKAGYHSAATVHPGLYSIKNKYHIPRIQMNAYDTLSSFEKKITTGYHSSGQRLRSSIRDILFHNDRLKDLTKKIAGNRINLL